MNFFYSFLFLGAGVYIVFFFRYRDVETFCFAKRIINCSEGNERGKVSQRGCCYVYTYKKSH